MNRHAVCTRARDECDDCGRPKCSRCGRCKSVGYRNPGDRRLYCPSNWCRLRRLLPV